MKAFYKSIERKCRKYQITYSDYLERNSNHYYVVEKRHFYSVSSNILRKLSNRDISNSLWGFPYREIITFPVRIIFLQETLQFPIDYIPVTFVISLTLFFVSLRVKESLTPTISSKPRFPSIIECFNESFNEAYEAFIELPPIAPKHWFCPKMFQNHEKSQMCAIKSWSSSTRDRN